MNRLLVAAIVVLALVGAVLYYMLVTSHPVEVPAFDFLAMRSVENKTAEGEYIKVQVYMSGKVYKLEKRAALPFMHADVTIGEAKTSGWGVDLDGDAVADVSGITKMHISGVYMVVQGSHVRNVMLLAHDQVATGEYKIVGAWLYVINDTALWHPDYPKSPFIIVELQGLTAPGNYSVELGKRIQIVPPQDITMENIWNTYSSKFYGGRPPEHGDVLHVGAFNIRFTLVATGEISGKRLVIDYWFGHAPQPYDRPLYLPFIVNGVEHSWIRFVYYTESATGTVTPPEVTFSSFIEGLNTFVVVFVIIVLLYVVYLLYKERKL